MIHRWQWINNDPSLKIPKPNSSSPKQQQVLSDMRITGPGHGVRSLSINLLLRLLVLLLVLIGVSGLLRKDVLKNL